MNLKKLIRECNRTARTSGFFWTWKDVGRQLMWATSELGEAFQSWREDDHEHTLEEIADCFITLADLLGDIDPEGKFISILEKKMEFNKKRKKFHGAKKA